MYGYCLFFDECDLLELCAFVFAVDLTALARFVKEVILVAVSSTSGCKYM